MSCGCTGWPGQLRKQNRTTPKSTWLSVEAAALLHDMADDKAYSATELTSPEKLTPILTPMGFTPQQIERVVDAINTHSYSRGLKATTHEAQILQDASAAIFSAGDFGGVGQGMT